MNYRTTSRATINFFHTSFSISINKEPSTFSFFTHICHDTKRHSECFVLYVWRDKEDGVSSLKGGWVDG